MEEQKHEFRMINVMSMIETLTMLYDKGVDYVDISGKQGDEQDEICFSFCKSYMDEEYKETFETGFVQEEEEEIISKPAPRVTFKLTDKDINDLIL
jgi:hypothetical protein